MIHVRFSCNAANLIVEAGLLDLADEDVISLAGDLNTLLGHVAENADGDTGTGEGVAVDKRFVDAELATDVLHCLVKGFNLILHALHTRTSSLNRSLRGSISCRIPLASCLDRDIGKNLRANLAKQAGGLVRSDSFDRSR